MRTRTRRRPPSGQSTRVQRWGPGRAVCDRPRSSRRLAVRAGGRARRMGPLSGSQARARACPAALIARNPSIYCPGPVPGTTNINSLTRRCRPSVSSRWVGRAGHVPRVSGDQGANSGSRCRRWWLAWSPARIRSTTWTCSGGMSRLFSGVRAPSTLGIFLRRCQFGRHCAFHDHYLRPVITAPKV